MARVREFEAVAIIYEVVYGEIEVTDEEVLDVFHRDPEDPDFPAASDYSVSDDSLAQSVYKYTIEIRDEDNRVIDAFTAYNSWYDKEIA